MKDNAPVKNTCPTIDKCQKSIKSAIASLSGLEDYEIRNALSELEWAIDYLEEIRSANAELRDWGNELHSDVESLKNELDTLHESLQQ